jgi:hypothetical protein
MFKFRLLLGPDRMYIICCRIITLKKNTKLLTLYNNKHQHQETSRIKNETNEHYFETQIGLEMLLRKYHVMQLNSVDLLLVKILLHWFDSPKLFHSLSLTHTSDFYDYLALPLPCCLCFLPTPFLLCFVTFLNTSANDSN